MKLAAAALALMFASGCETAPAVNATPPAQSSPLSLSLEAPSEALAGTPIQLKLVLRNTSTQPAQVMLGGRPPYDFILSSGDGTRAWRWSDEKAAQMILEMRTLKPGEEIAYDVQWLVNDRDGNAPLPGRYVIKGLLNMDPPDTLETAPADLTITAE